MADQINLKGDVESFLLQPITFPSNQAKQSDAAAAEKRTRAATEH